MQITPLKKLRFKIGWRLNKLHQELKRKKLYISWPTLVKIDNACRYIEIKNAQGKIIDKKKVKYNPNKKSIQKIAKLLRVKKSAVYSQKNQK